MKTLTAELLPELTSIVLDYYYDNTRNMKKLNIEYHETFDTNMNRLYIVIPGDSWQKLYNYRSIRDYRNKPIHYYDTSIYNNKGEHVSFLPKNW